MENIWLQHRRNIEEANRLWDSFPRKENLNPEHVQNIDLIFFCLKDTLNKNEFSLEVDVQFHKLVKSLEIAFRILLS